jgi:mRNA interferase HigB
MQVISRKKLRPAATRHADLEAPLDAWFRIANKATWRDLGDIRKTFSSADATGKWTGLNIKGKQHRLIAEINYLYGRLYSATS